MSGPVANTPWNHNIHHQDLLVRALPRPCGSVLDLGCGQGFLLPPLAAAADEVVGIDVDAPVLAEARSRVAGLANVEVVEGDVMAADLGRTFDAVVSIAVLHHLPLDAGLARMRDLTSPGGVVGVVGLARSSRPRDWAMDAVGAVETRLRRRRRSFTEVRAPMCDPAETYAEVATTARRILPGVRLQRHPLFRYSLLWTKPPV